MTYFMRIFLRPLAHACVLCLFPSYSCSGTAFGHSMHEAFCVLWACSQSINPWQTEMQSIKLHFLTRKTCTEPKKKGIQTTHLCSNTFLSSLPEYFRMFCRSEVLGDERRLKKQGRRINITQSELTLHKAMEEWTTPDPHKVPFKMLLHMFASTCFTTL